MKYEIKESENFGKGGFATTDIEKGETIAVYEGEEVDRDEIHRRIVEGLERADDPLQIGEDLFLDIVNDAYFFNHSCEPNAGLRGQKELIAIKDIKKGEEIAFDYSTTVGTNVKDWTMNCACGSANCRKTIGNVLTIPKDQLEKYYEAGTLQDYIREQIGFNK